jgi:hypothetical protein
MITIRKALIRDVDNNDTSAMKGNSKSGALRASLRGTAKGREEQTDKDLSAFLLSVQGLPFLAKTLFVKLSQMTMGRFDGRPRQSTTTFSKTYFFSLFSPNPSIVPEMHTVSAANTKPQPLAIQPTNQQRQNDMSSIRLSFWMKCEDMRHTLDITAAR